MWSAASTSDSFETAMWGKWDLLAKAGLRVSKVLLDPKERLGEKAVQDLEGPQEPPATLPDSTLTK